MDTANHIRQSIWIRLSVAMLCVVYKLPSWGTLPCVNHQPKGASKRYQPKI